MNPIARKFNDQVAFERNFVDMSRENVRQAIYDKAMTFLYKGSCQEMRFNLVIRWAQVYGGLGDMSSAVKTVQLFRSVFSQAQIFLTVYLRSEGEPSVIYDLSGKASDLCLGILSPSRMREHLPALPTIMLDMSTPKSNLFPFSVDDISQNLTGCFHIFEYNLFTNSKGGAVADFSDHSTYSLGIGQDENGVPCMGIHFNPHLKHSHPRLSSAVKNLEDRDLAAWLSNGMRRRALNRKQFYFGYSTADDPGYWTRFLHSVLMYESISGYHDDVDFVFLSKGRRWPSHFVTTIIPLSWHDSVFKEFQLYEGTVCRYCLPLNPDARCVVRICLWNKKRLSHRDTLQLIQTTGAAILCTGDQSFAEAASLGDRAIFYEPLEWKKQFYHQVCEIARRYFGDESPFHTFMECMRHQPGAADLGFTHLTRKMGRLLANPEFQRQNQEYLELLGKHYNGHEWLVSLVSRNLAHTISPNLLDWEDVALKLLVTDGSREAQDICIKTLTDIIQEFKQIPVKKKKRGREARAVSYKVKTTEKRARLYHRVLELFPEEIAQGSTKGKKKRKFFK